MSMREYTQCVWRRIIPNDNSNLSFKWEIEMKTFSHPHETSKDSSIKKHDFSYPSKTYSVKKLLIKQDLDLYMKEN